MGIGPFELIIILAIILLLFGGSKLPELGEAVGKTVKNFKKGMEDGASDDKVEAASAKADASATKAEESTAKAASNEKVEATTDSKDA